MKQFKKKIVTLIAILCVSLVSGQAKKPTIMVIPSDVWCNTNKYMTTFDNQGTATKIPDYKKAFQENADLLRRYHQAGYHIFIWSSRHWDDHKEVTTWLKRHKIPFEGIWLGKPLVREFWDDRSYNPNCTECKAHAKVLIK